MLIKSSLYIHVASYHAGPCLQHEQMSSIDEGACAHNHTSCPFQKHTCNVQMRTNVLLLKQTCCQLLQQGDPTCCSSKRPQRTHMFDVKSGVWTQHTAVRAFTHYFLLLHPSQLQWQGRSEVVHRCTARCRLQLLKLDVNPSSLTDSGISNSDLAGASTKQSSIAHSLWL